MAGIRFFAAAAEAAGSETTTVDVASIGDLRMILSDRHGAEFAKILSRCSLLVNGIRAADDAVPLAGTDTVDVLPPFAGG
ncbi:MoaD/ThiS family protein [Cryobacterium breve]|uniref:MoaD/ThiS family protein n=1 Tax=Cryobacterium breve TaxID=1259258 RepID=A0ABY7NCN3_9MICO|nr:MULTISPECIES: MoaD/ThiS family protein [Cryobacterium]MDY7543499.1 MoaD/ThiS family protein [Cryobacterium sp. 5B3]MEA9999744.1 MoaD/ThiS family protein [Cryobacterium sp. RTS3]MEB0266242.1 MoaD/ThiS family protein [Cryobacterium sp. 10I5]MEB0273143.1 MoaD/ThiS family protein [Cryobacterium sp. 5B3]WBM80049.1 MoaD/ThiS family protein [Cryobacterium breve]